MMKKRQKPSKQVVTCIIVMLFIVLAFFVFSKENEQRIMKQNLEYIQDSTVQVARQIDHVLSDGEKSIRILSTFLSQSLDRPEVDIVHVRKLAKDSVFDFLEFADKDGMNHNITGGVSDARDRKYFLDGIKGNVGMELIFNSRATHETLLMFYSPVTFEGEIVGVLIGAYQADNKLVKMLTTKYFGEPANVYLCTSEGRVVASNKLLDTEKELYITDIVKEDAEIADHMRRSIENGKTLQFTLESEKSGGCLTKLQETGWYLVQIFPEAANITMVRKANKAGVLLEIMLLLIFAVVLVLLVHFHRKERKYIAQLAEERGDYKNAVLADATIVFDANLTKNQIAEGMWKDRDGKILSVEELLDLSLPCDYDTYIVQWANAYVEEESQKLFLKNTDRRYLINEFQKGKSEITFEYYAKTWKGEKSFVRRSIYLAADKKSGDIIAYINVKDITEQKNREKQMHQYEQMLVMMASGMYQGAWQIDLSDFSTVYLSFENNHIIPWEKEHWKVWFDRQQIHVQPEDREKLKEELSEENLLKMPVGETFRYDFRSQTKNKHGFNKVYCTNVLKAEWDGKQYINMVTMDNTATVENEMKQKALIEDALFRAESASKAKTMFLSNMSHDIRTPMNAIIGFTSLAIRQIHNTERVQDYLEKIAASSNHLLSLINDVLDMSRIESGRISLEEKECNLSELIEELKNIVTLEMQSRELRFEIDMAEVSDVQIICDRLRLNQVLLNLLSNAMKFTRPGGSVHVKITEKEEEIGEKAVYEFRVKDTGIGMSEEFLEHVFEPFEREHTSTVSGIQGTGLGMAITKNIVEMMGGTISVSSPKNMGTEFIVQIPMTRVFTQQSEKGSGEKENGQADPMDIKGKRILLVEDNALNREIAGEILKEAGLLVEEAENGQAAIDQIVEHGPGYYMLVLMDIQMPIMDGYSATKEIRRLENKELADIPIIAMTANAFEEDKREAINAGMNAHIAKPIDVNRLLDVMGQYLI